MRTWLIAALTAALSVVCCLVVTANALADPVLAAAGDIACAPGDSPTATSCRQASSASEIANAQPTAVATLGDNQYNSGTLSEYQGSFDPTWGQIGIPMFPAPGNHEYADTTNGEPAYGYFTYFGSKLGHPVAPYYSYDLGSWHLIALNSNCTDAGGCQNYEGGLGGVTQAELDWLNTDLATHAGMCTIAYWHHPRFSSGNTEAAQGGDPGVAPLWNALYSHHVAIVLNGHEHHYERFLPQDPNALENADGITEFIVGTGGHDLGDPFSARAANCAVRDQTDFGVLFLTLHATSYDWSFRSTIGAVADSGSASCHLPPVATTLAAVQIGQSSATLFGSVDARNDVASWHFDYGTTAAYGHSTAGGSTTTGESGPFPDPIYGLQPATTYHYRFVATSAAGTGYGSDRTFTTGPRVAAPARIRLASLLKKGLRVHLTSATRWPVTARILSGHHTLALLHRTLRAGTSSLVIRLSQSGRRWLAAHRPRSVLLSLVFKGPQLSPPIKWGRTVRFRYVGVRKTALAPLPALRI